MKKMILSDERRRSLLYPSTGQIHLVIDTDAKNEVDDQFAIAWALRSKDRFIVDAVYAAPFAHDCFRQFNQAEDAMEKSASAVGHSAGPADGMEQSFQEIQKLFALLDEPTADRVFRGAERYIGSDGAPVESEAVRDLILRVHKSQEPIYVAAIGAVTNIASAILVDPSIVDNMVVVWLGGNALGFGQGVEFNLIQDLRAAQTIFNSGVPLIWIPCLNVASLLSVSECELREYLLHTTPIGDYLARTVLDAFSDPQSDIAFMKLNQSSSLRENSDEDDGYLAQFPTEKVAWSRIIWDIATIAILKNPNWLPSKLIPSPVLHDDYTWETTASNRHLIRMATHCYRNMVFGDLFEALTKPERE